MHELVQQRRLSIDGQGSGHIHRGDIFTRVVEALDPEAKFGLEENEAVRPCYPIMQTHSDYYLDRQYL